MTQVPNERKRKLALALMIIESSSDEGSSDDDVLQLLIKQKILRPKLSKHCNFLDSYSSEAKFMQEFRMSKRTCSKLITDFHKSPHYPKNDSHGGLPRSSAEIHILSFLRFAGSKTSISDVAKQFNIGFSSFHRSMSRVMNYLVEIAPTIIKFPDARARSSVVRKFQEISGFPGIVGSLDCTYIPIRTPANKNKSDLVNHHQQTSLTLQGICDPDGAFLDIFTGPPSKVHDGKVFQLSFVRKRLPVLCTGDLHLVADDAFPLSDYVLTPYKSPNGLLSQAQANYNGIHQATREPTRLAFRSLKQRFRQLSRLDFHQMDTAAKFSLCCCVLHNLCVRAKDVLPAEEANVNIDDEIMELLYDDPIDEELTDPEEIQSRQLGEIKRDRICGDLWAKVGERIIP